MKMKVKFNTAAIKEMLLEHGEKIAFGAAALVFAWFCYGALRRETLPADKGPDRLAAAAQSAQSHVASSTFDPTKLELPIADYGSKTKRRLIDVANYSRGVMNDPIGDPLQKRTDPQLVGIEGLRIAAGAGTFAYVGKNGGPVAEPQKVGRPNVPRPPAPPKRRNGEEEDILLGGGGAARAAEGRNLASGVVIPGVRPPSGSQLKPTYWTVVTAVVPYRKQAGEFEKVFNNAVGGDPARDVPNYLGYQIMRAEDTGGDPDKLTWTKINLLDAKKIQATWAIEATEVVDPEFLDPKFTMPLGPLVGAWWTPDVGHHPEILFVQGKMDAALDEDAEAEPGDDEPAAEDEPADEDGFVDMADQGDAVAAQPGVRRPRGAGLAGVEGGRMPRAGQAGNRDKKFGRENDLLFRFFDFNVEPGKTYRYKVMLGIENPNFGVDVKYLKGGMAQKKKILTTEWSEPTPPATVPFTDGLLARAVTRTSAKIAVYKIDESSGLEVLTTEEFPRGNVINFVKTVDDVLNPISNSVEKRESVPFTTNAILVDMHGGKPLDAKDKTQTEPGEVLLIDRDGNLVVHDEMDDLPTFRAKDPKELLDGTAPQSGGAPNWGGILNEEKPAKPVRTPRTPRSGRTRTPKQVAPKPPAATKAKATKRTAD